MTDKLDQLNSLQNQADLERRKAERCDTLLAYLDNHKKRSDNWKKDGRCLMELFSILVRFAHENNMEDLRDRVADVLSPVAGDIYATVAARLRADKRQHQMNAAHKKATVEASILDLDTDSEV